MWLHVGGSVHSNGRPTPEFVVDGVPSSDSAGGDIRVALLATYSLELTEDPDDCEEVRWRLAVEGGWKAVAELIST